MDCTGKLSRKCCPLCRQHISKVVKAKNTTTTTTTTNDDAIHISLSLTSSTTTSSVGSGEVGDVFHQKMNDDGDDSGTHLVAKEGEDEDLNSLFRSSSSSSPKQKKPKLSQERSSSSSSIASTGGGGTGGGGGGGGGQLASDALTVGRKSILQKLNMSQFQSSSKIEAVVKGITNMIASNPQDKGIIFSQYRTMIDLVEWRLRNAGVEVVKLMGDMNLGERRSVLAAFKQSSTVKVSVCVSLYMYMCVFKSIMHTCLLLLLTQIH
jgi:hypothetical protein